MVARPARPIDMGHGCQAHATRSAHPQTQCPREGVLLASTRTPTPVPLTVWVCEDHGGQLRALGWRVRVPHVEYVARSRDGFTWQVEEIA